MFLRQEDWPNSNTISVKGHEPLCSCDHNKIRVSMKVNRDKDEIPAMQGIHKGKHKYVRKYLANIDGNKY